MTVALLVAGSVVVLVAASRTWSVSACGGLTGSTCAADAVSNPGPRALGGLAIAAVAALLATFAARGRLRTVVGVAIALMGVGVVAICVTTTHGPPARWVGALGGALIAAAGGLVVRHGRSWPSMSSRYEREARAAGKPVTAWDAIDRGEDPTA